MDELAHFIDGQRVAGTSGRFADVYNPATGEVQSRVPLASSTEVDLAVRGAVTAHSGWSATNPQRRARILMEFVRLLTRDMDKPRRCPGNMARPCQTPGVTSREASKSSSSALERHIF